MRMQTADSFRKRVKKIEYPISAKALEKWVKHDLTLLDSENGKRHYLFHYHGSTCTNGGTPFQAGMHAVCSCKRNRVILEKGWIEFTEEQSKNAREMCASKRDDKTFFQQLQQRPGVEGKPLEKIIKENAPINAAGCFCSEPMVNHKWKWVASVIHYSILEDHLNPE